MEDLSIMKQHFNYKINMLKAKKGRNSQLFTRDQYYSLLEKIKTSKNKTSHKLPEDYQRLSRYDIVKISEVERLIVPQKNDSDPIIYYVFLEEIFDIIHKIHNSIGHGGRNKMMKELKAKYKNITAEFVMTYLSFCETCRKRMSILKKEHIVESSMSSNEQTCSQMSSEFNSRCQIDLIDMKSQVDGDYKYIMIYQEYFTKFIQLKALKTKRTKEVAYHLLDIFTTFGAPNTLQSGNGLEFANKVIEEVYDMWEQPKIWHEKPRSSQSEAQGTVETIEEDIQEMLSTWMETNMTTKWSEGLRFIQYMKNRAHHAILNRSPYEAMFGCKAKIGLVSSLPNNKSFDIKIEPNIEENVLEQSDYESNKVTSVNYVSIKTEHVSMDVEHSNEDLSNDEHQCDVSNTKNEHQYDASKMHISE